MSDGPLPKSTCGVDSSPEAIAAMVARLRAHPWGTDRFFDDAAALLAQVGRERDAALDMERWLIEKLVAAERQLAEARAELDAYRAAAQYDACMDGPKFKGWNRSQLDRARKITEARALLSGETT